MSTYKISSLATLLIFLFSGCNYLDVVPDDVATIDDAFADRQSAEGYLATCYSYQPNHGDPWVNPGLLAGDEVWFNEELENVEGQLIAKGFQNSNTPYLSFWDGNGRGKNMFIGIRDCNIFLENIDLVYDITEVERKRWKAEVKFLKAYYHYWLLKSYGPIPIIRENLPIYVDSEDVKVYRDPVDDVVNYIVELIDEAVEDLPLRLMSDAIELGRITKPIALAIKARVLSTAASPLFNGNTDFASMVDNRGVALFNPTFDANKWQLAADAAKEAIEVAEMAGHSLVSNYVSKTDYPEAEINELIARSICTERENPEIIWGATHFVFAENYQRMLMPLLIPVTASNPVSQYYAATMRMAELFYTNNGVPIEEDINYDYAGRFELRTATAADSSYVLSGAKTAKLHFDREARFYANIAFDRGAYILDPNYYYVNVRAGELATKRNRAEFSATGYFVKKLISPKNAISQTTIKTNYNFPFPIIRLGDLYLLYAEALNEVKSAPDAEVYEYVDRIRARAGLEGVMESWTAYSKAPDKPTTKAGMREIIRKERMIELAFEGQRFWDLRRWKQSEDYMNRPIRGWNIAGPGLDFYNVTTIFVPSFTFKDYLWPIATGEIIANPNLVQNPGW